MKRFLIALAIAAVIAVAVFVAGFLRALSRFCTEDRITDTYAPVACAIQDYCDTNHVAPAGLADLVPGFLPALPSNCTGEAVSYRKTGDATNWALGITVVLGRERRTFFQSSDECAHPSSTTNELGRIHQWRVFEEPRK